jgi:hypothetical protein
MMPSSKLIDCMTPKGKKPRRQRSAATDSDCHCGTVLCCVIHAIKRVPGEFLIDIKLIYI